MRSGSDLVNALGLWRLWIFMGWQDIKRRYRGSVLGPIWLAGGVATISLGIGTLYSNIFNIQSDNFLLFVTLGMIVWTFITISIAEGCSQFFENGGMIKNATLPVNIYGFRLVWRNLILLAHNAVVGVLVFIYSGQGLEPVALLAIPGLALLIINIWWMSLLSGLLATRFRDVGQIITYFMQFAMFVTPLFWYPGMVGDRHFAISANPFYHLLEVVRGPLLGNTPSAENWIFVGVLAICGVGATWLAQAKFIKRVAFWI